MLYKMLQHVLQTDGIFAALCALRAYPPVGLTQCDVQTVYSKTYDEDNVLQGYTLCDASTWLHAQPNTFGLPPDNDYGVCCDMYMVMSFTRKVVREKARVERDLIKSHPLIPRLSTELFAQKGIGAFWFSPVLIEWSQSELEGLQKIWVEANKHAWYIPWSTTNSLYLPNRRERP